MTFLSCYGTKPTSKLPHPPSSEAAPSARTPEHAYMIHIVWRAMPLSRLTTQQASNRNNNYDIISFDFNLSFHRLDNFFTSWRYYKTIKCQAWHCCKCEETFGKWPWTYLNRRGPPNYTVGHRRQVTAVTRLPRWRRRKTRLRGRPLLIML